MEKSKLNTSIQVQQISKLLTWKIPWIELVEINVSDDLQREMVAGDFPAEVLHEELLVGRKKPESRRQAQLRARIVFSDYSHSSVGGFRSDRDQWNSEIFFLLQLFFEERENY